MKWPISIRAPRSGLGACGIWYAVHPRRVWPVSWQTLQRCGVRFLGLLMFPRVASALMFDYGQSRLDSPNFRIFALAFHQGATFQPVRAANTEVPYP
jgi:hypothetical protein